MNKKPTYDELAAHVERLRLQLDHGIFEVAEWMRSFPDAVTQEERDCLEAMREVFNESPAQSLNHIMAQVEEETIRSDAIWMCLNLDEDTKERLIKTKPRKYSNQPEAAEKDGE